MERSCQKSLSPHPGPNLGTGRVSGLAVGSAISDRMPRFHEDSRNPEVSPDIAMQHKMNTTTTNAYENEPAWAILTP